MRGLLCTALVIAVASTFVSAEIQLNVTNVDFSVERRYEFCLATCHVEFMLKPKMVTGYYSRMSQNKPMSEVAYHDLNLNISSKELFDNYCPDIYGYRKCMSDCKQAYNLVNVTERFVAEVVPATVVIKSCLSIIDKLPTLNTLTECADKIYPLIATPEENAKCKKMCCSDPSQSPWLYACNLLTTYDQDARIYGTYPKEDMCQLACVIDQAAKHAKKECSPVLYKMLLAARQDVLKIYHQHEKNVKETREFLQQMKPQVELEPNVLELYPRDTQKPFYQNFYPVPAYDRTSSTKTVIEPIEMNDVYIAEMYDRSLTTKTEEALDF